MPTFNQKQDMLVEIEKFKNMAYSMVFWAGPLACGGHPLVN
jgi:hypothetical protein